MGRKVERNAQALPNIPHSAQEFTNRWSVNVGRVPESALCNVPKAVSDVQQQEHRQGQAAEPHHIEKGDDQSPQILAR